MASCHHIQAHTQTIMRYTCRGERMENKVLDTEADIVGEDTISHTTLAVDKALVNKCK